MLSFVLAPYGQIPGAYPSTVAQSYGGGGKYLCPPDPQYNTIGEQGFYYDTALGKVSLGRKPLGDIPTDAELAINRGYTPVTSGWVTAKEGFFPAPWNPPNGWNAAGAYGPQMSLNGRGLRDGNITLPTTATASETQSVVDALNAQNQRVFKVTVISAVVVGFAALLNSYRMIRQLSRDEALFAKHAKHLARK